MSGLKRVLLLSILLLCMLAPMQVSAQGGAPIGVDVECDQQTININVHPEQNAPVTISCTVTNTGMMTENINLDSNVDGNDFSLTISESSVSLGAGEDASFTATFSASPRIAVISQDFNITATIESVGMEPIMIPLGQAGSTAEVGGTVNSLPYSRMELEISNTNTRNVEAGEEVKIQFTMFNDGNRVDNLETLIVNQMEVQDAGFKFNGDAFVRAQVQPGASSDQGEIILIAPSSPKSEVNIQVTFRAYSQLDSDAEPSEVTIRFIVSASESSTSVDLTDIDITSNDGMATIAMGVGALIGVILLLVIISRLTKKATGGKKEAYKLAKKAEKEQKKAAKRAARRGEVLEEFDEDPPDLDLGDLDDLDDFDDDFDFDDL